VIVFRDIRTEKAQQNEVLFLSYHDPLTGLNNRRFIESEIHRLDEELQLPFSVVMGDVNGLKIANDIFSHATGDKLLIKVSETFKECKGKTDIVARWGGDEFLMLMPGSPLKDAEKMIRWLKKRFMEKSEGTMQLSVSLGCAEKSNPVKTSAT
jgi:diguanylate cyclase (GGDEF)-like protein